MNILVTGGSGFIGTNLIEKLIALPFYTIINIDNAKPKIDSHLKHWKECDILDSNQVNQVFNFFKPEIVIHLAARTDTDPNTKIEDYIVNTQGSSNIIKAIKQTKAVKLAIMTSTQFVNQYNGAPKHDEDYAPHTIYGESKIIMEKEIRNANLTCTWTIIRPTNIWGPWHIRYPYEFWKIVSKGLYFHPGNKPVIRSYGYVGNVVSQIIAIINSPYEKIHKQVLYVGDTPIDVFDWVNGFSINQIGKPVKVIPRFFLKALGIVGDILFLFKIKFPITSSRYKSMTHSNSVSMQKTFNLLGKPPYTLQQGIEETVGWMKNYFPELIKR